MKPDEFFKAFQELPAEDRQQIIEYSERVGKAIGAMLRSLECNTSWRRAVALAQLTDTVGQGIAKMLQGPKGGGATREMWVAATINRINEMIDIDFSRVIDREVKP